MGAITGGHLEIYDEALASDPMVAFGLVDEWLRTDWRDLFAELRQRRPIFATPAYTLVTRFTDVTEVLTHEEIFTVRAFGPRLDAALGTPFMLGWDATPMNWREKGLMKVMLAPRDVADVRELVARLADEALDAAAATGRIEAVHGLFRHVALGVCERYFGYTGVDLQRLSGWIRAIITDCFANYRGDPDLQVASVQAGTELMAYLQGELATRRAAHQAGRPLPDDIFTRLVTTT